MDNFDIEPENGSPKKTRKGLNTVLWGVGSFVAAVAVFALIATFFFPKTSTVTVETKPTEAVETVTEEVVEEGVVEETPATATGESKKACDSFLGAMGTVDGAKFDSFLAQAATETTNPTILSGIASMQAALKEGDGNAVAEPMATVIEACVADGSFTWEEYTKVIESTL